MLSRKLSVAVDNGKFRVPGIGKNQIIMCEFHKESVFLAACYYTKQGDKGLFDNLKASLGIQSIAKKNFYRREDSIQDKNQPSVNNSRIFWPGLSALMKASPIKKA